MQSSYNLEPLNSNIYSAGNVALNSQPFVNYALETQARNKAKEEAFIKSFQNIVSSTTPAGMAANDIPSFMQKKQDWINFILKNKDAYENPTKDNGKAYGQAMSMYNQVLQHSENSKSKLKSLAPLNSVFQSPDKSKRLTEQAMQNYHNGALPVDDPNYQPFDISSVDFNDKPFEQKDLLALDNNIKNLLAPSLKNKTYGKARIDAETHSKYTPYSIKLTDNDYNNIRSNAALLSGTNASFANFLDNELNNPDDYNTLNKVYQSHFGKDASIGSREDMATALFLSRAAPNLTGEEKSTYSPDNFYAHRQYAAEHPLPSRAAGGTSSTGTNLVEDIATAAQNKDNAALQGAVGNLYKGNGGEKFLGATVDDNGNLTIRTQHTVKNKPVQISKTYSANSDELKNMLAGKVQSIMGADKKMESKQYDNNTPSIKPAAEKTYNFNGKSVKHAELIKMGYTEAQIQQAIKMGNLK